MSIYLYKGIRFDFIFLHRDMKRQDTIEKLTPTSCVESQNHKIPPWASLEKDLTFYIVGGSSLNRGTWLINLSAAKMRSEKVELTLS